MNRPKEHRTQSISSLTLPDKSYNTTDLQKLYESVIKIILLQYSTEARFRTPIPIVAPPTTTPTTYSKYYRSSKLDVEPVLPSYLISSLETRLNLIALKKKDNSIDELTRRSLLRLYSELLGPDFKNDILRVNKPQYLVMKFVSCANKELVKISELPPHEISEQVFKQATSFVQILIDLIRRDKDSDAFISTLEETKESLKPKSNNTVVNVDTVNVQYPKPSYRITDMDQSLVQLIQDLFNVDQVKLQQDVFKFKDLAKEKTLQKDINQIQFYLGKDLGHLSPKSFCSEKAYKLWKEGEESSCNSLLEKYQVPPSLKLLPVPDLPSGDDFYILPRSAHTKKYYVMLVKLCIELECKQNPNTYLNLDRPFLSKPSINILTICGRIWRISPSTKASALFTAAHLSGALKVQTGKSEELYPINIEATTKVFHWSKTMMEDAGFDWDEKDLWSINDQEDWIRALTCSYNELLFALKDSLMLIFNKTIKPKFGPYLMFLGEYLESDSLFSKVDPGLVKKWEKKLSKALLRVAETRYATLLGNLPRDDTLSIIHILDISDSIVGDIRMLQKKYKNPLLGFLHVARTVGAVNTAMFAADAKNILKHIDAYARNKNEFIPYSDALEAYKSLSEIRDIHSQVSTAGSTFKFDLEAFFFPFLKSWVEESGEKILQIVAEAIKSDNYEPIDLDIDEKKYSRSVLDIFALIREFLRILESLKWADEFQLATAYTTLLRSISDGALYYANNITEKIMKELDEEEQNKLAMEMEEAKTESRKSGNWFDEVKNVVSNMQNSNKTGLEKPYNFRPETCIALNNLGTMMQRLTKLEDVLDPEMISNSVNAYDPTSQQRYLSHIFSLRLVKAENLKSTSSSLRSYVTLIDTKARRTIGKTRTINNTSNPEWDEEFELTLPANSTLTVSATVWDEKFGTHSICGRALIQLDPRRFKHDGLPQEVYLDLDSQGRVLVEIAVESERMDAIFVMGRAHRTLMRCQERCVKLIVEKFSRFIHHCFSRNNLRSICGNTGQLKPTQDQMDLAMMPLYNYLNLNLQVLAEFLTKDLLLKVMLASWNVVVSSADKLLLPKLTSAKTLSISSMGSKLTNGQSGWSAVTSAVANVSISIGISGFGKLLTNNELETVLSWLNFLCFDFFHNDGNGPPIRELKSEPYQALLLVPVYYDRDEAFLQDEVERLSPAFIKTLRDRNNFDSDDLPKIGSKKPLQPVRAISRAISIYRNKTIMANATVRARAQAAQEAQEAKSDPTAAQVLAEDIILRILIIKDQKAYVAKRLDQRERLARSIATERLARAAAEGKLH